MTFLFYLGGRAGGAGLAIWAAFHLLAGQAAPSPQFLQPQRSTDWVSEQADLQLRAQGADHQIIPLGRPSVKVPILMYHYIRVNPPGDVLGFDLSVPRTDFQAQMDFLAGHAYHPIDFNDMRAYFQGQAPLPSKPVIITLDDGYADLYTDAYPVLRDHNFKAVAYIISGFLNDANHHSVTRDQIVEMDHHGIQIGAHTVSHKDLTKLSHAELTREVVGCKADLEQLVGHPILDFAFPSGRHNPAAVQAVTEAGFDTATTTELGIQHALADRFLWARVRVHGGESLAFFASSLGAEEPAIPGRLAPSPTPDPLEPLRQRNLSS